MAWFRWTVTSICVAATATTVYAQPHSEGGTLQPPTTEGETLQAPTTEGAPTTSGGETMRQRGDAAMRESRYADAAAAYVDAYAAMPDPELLLAIGDSNQKLGNCEVAVGYYRRYLRAVELTPDIVSIVDDRIAGCRGAAPGATDTAQAKPRPPLRASKQWMIGLELGAGGGAHGGTEACDCDPQLSARASHVHVAKLQSPRLAWVASTGRDGQIVTLDGAPDDLGHITFAAGVRAWPTPRLWIEGTGGFAVASIPWDPVTYSCPGRSGPDDTSTTTCSSDSQKIGLGLSGSVGVELLSFRSFALSARGRIASGFYSDLRLVTATAGFSADVFF